MTDGQEMIRLDGIGKIYNPGDVTEMCLFTDFSLSVAKGEFVSVVGSNGSGKTSLLNIICGSVPVDAGRIVIDGRDVTNVPEHLRYARIGRVWQNPATGTCSYLTILENMALADCGPGDGKPASSGKRGAKCRRFGLTAGISPARVEFYRERLATLGLGLEDKLGQRAGALSGGQRQAMALIMSTLTPIDILILDEHTAALDPRTAELIMELTDRVVREKKLTAVMVTHNLRFAADYGDRLLMLHAGHAVLDVAGEEKRKKTVNDLLGLFTEISIECGN
ncbi:aBC transporter ATP-binding protein [Anaerotruncus sp. CAG:390]|nr:aBC transporter ATP-binding protein [Anaerotruncus sp. CAG:390]